MTTEQTIQHALANLTAPVLADVSLTAGEAADKFENKPMLASWAGSIRDLAGAEAARRRGKAEAVDKAVTGLVHASSLLTAVEAMAALEFLRHLGRSAPAAIQLVPLIERQLARACHQAPHVKVN